MLWNLNIMLLHIIDMKSQILRILIYTELIFLYEWRNNEEVWQKMKHFLQC
jgi:hypothetical protein